MVSAGNNVATPPSACSVLEKMGKACFVRYLLVRGARGKELVAVGVLVDRHRVARAAAHARGDEDADEDRDDAAVLLVDPHATGGGAGGVAPRGRGGSNGGNSNWL